MKINCKEELKTAGNIFTLIGKVKLVISQGLLRFARNDGLFKGLLRFARNDGFFQGALVLSSSLFYCYILSGQMLHNTFNQNDMILHEGLVRSILDSWKQVGSLGLDLWYDKCCFGNPVFRTYQNLPHFLAAAATYYFGETNLTLVMQSITLAVLVLQCLAFYFAARLLGLNFFAALAASWLSLSVSSALHFGNELRSYIPMGYGLYAQAVSVPFFIIGIALAIRAFINPANNKHDKRKTEVILGLVFAITFLCHHFSGFILLLIYFLLSIINLKKFKLKSTIINLSIVILVFSCICSYQILSLLQDYLHFHQSPWESIASLPGYDVDRSFKYLITGKLLDNGRFPVLSILAFTGILLSLRKNSPKGVRYLVFIFISSLAGLSLIVFSGNMGIFQLPRFLNLTQHVLLVFFAGYTVQAIMEISAHNPSLRGRLDETAEAISAQSQSISRRLLRRFAPRNDSHFKLLRFLRDGLCLRSDDRFKLLLKTAEIFLIVCFVAALFYLINERKNWISIADQKKEITHSRSIGWQEDDFKQIKPFAKEPCRFWAGFPTRQNNFFTPDSKFYHTKSWFAPVYPIAQKFGLSQMSVLEHKMNYTADALYFFNPLKKADYEAFNICSIMVDNLFKTPDFLHFMESRRAVAFYITGENNPFGVTRINSVKLLIDNEYYSALKNWGTEETKDFSNILIPQKFKNFAPKIANNSKENIDAEVTSWKKIENKNAAYIAEIHTTEENLVGFFKGSFHQNWNIEINGDKVKLLWITPGFVGFELKNGINKISLEFKEDPIRKILFYLTPIFCSLSLVWVFWRKPS